MTSIFVAKLDFSVTEDELRQLFAEYGRVNKASIAVDKETRKPRGFAFVEMADAEEAANAIKGLDGRSINGRQISVKEAEQRGDNRRNDGPRGGDRGDRRNDNGNRRPDFNNRNQNSSRTNVQSDYKKPIDDRPRGIVVTNPEEIKVEVKKKEKKVGGKDWDQDGKAKKPKMNAYKKSGKPSRFFDDDEDDDFDLNYKSRYDEDDDIDDFYADDEEE